MQAGVEYTIDELAREAGTTVRSLRVYHERGVLPPPQLKGRTGFYSPAHLNRVRTISRLLDRGIKLNGIKELLDAWDRGDNLGDVLGEADPGAPDLTGALDDDTITAVELEERYREVPNGLARVVSAGMYQPVDATTYRVADRQLIRIADRLTAIGIPPSEVLGELERLRTDCDRIALRFLDLFNRTAWEPFQRSQRAAPDLAELIERLDATRSVPGQATAELVDRLVARYLEQNGDLARVLTES